MIQLKPYQEKAVQTVGRILRMPEQRHYDERDELSYGYVYTNLSQSMIRIVAEDADYFSNNVAVRRAIYQDLLLKAEHINARLDRNRLGAKYYKALCHAAEAYFDFSIDFSKVLNGEDGSESQHLRNIRALQAKMVRTDVQTIEIAVAANLEFDLDDAYTKGGVEVDAAHKQRFARTSEELRQALRRFCEQNCGGYAKAESVPLMTTGLVNLLREYCGFDEKSGTKIILETNNSLHFVELLARSLLKHAELQQEAAKKRRQSVEIFTWDVPKERLYTDNYSVLENIPTHILQPFYVLHNTSRPEQEFVKFLEANSEYVQWWYKNGDSGREHFSIAYTGTDNKKRLFFADFVVLLKNGCLCVFDTKTSNSDALAPQKHNALHAWAKERTAQGKKTLGSVIIPHSVGETVMWKYPPAVIDNTDNLSAWEILVLSNVR